MCRMHDRLPLSFSFHSVIIHKVVIVFCLSPSTSVNNVDPSLHLVALATLLGSFGSASAQTTASSNGIVYNCPNVETIEVAYADDCPADPRTMMYELAGVSSSASYRNAPNDYTVPNGFYTLTCVYRASGGTTDALTCQYTGGSGVGLTQRDGSNAECPAVGQMFTQPSKRAEPRGLTKRFDQKPAFNCPWNSNRGDRFVYSVGISSGTRARSTDGGFRYGCTIAQPSGHSPLGCFYRADGTLVFANGGADQNDCPIRPCAAVRNGRRSVQAGVYVADDPIRRRQASVSKLRQDH